VLALPISVAGGIDRTRLSFMVGKAVLENFLLLRHKYSFIDSVFFHSLKCSSRHSPARCAPGALSESSSRKYLFVGQPCFAPFQAINDRAEHSLVNSRYYPVPDYRKKRISSPRMWKIGRIRQITCLPHNPKMLKF